jgi:hypothetical protein
VRRQTASSCTAAIMGRSEWLEQTAAAQGRGSPRHTSCLCGCCLCVCSHQVGCHTFCLPGHGYRGRRQNAYECLACLDYNRSEYRALLWEGLLWVSLCAHTGRLAAACSSSRLCGAVAPVPWSPSVATLRRLRLHVLPLLLLQASTMLLARPKQETRRHQVNPWARTHSSCTCTWLSSCRQRPATLQGSLDAVQQMV